MTLPFSAAVNGPIEPREQRRRPHSLFAGLNKLSVFLPAHVYTRLRILVLLAVIVVDINK